MFSPRIATYKTRQYRDPKGRQVSRTLVRHVTVLQITSTPCRSGRQSSTEMSYINRTVGPISVLGLITLLGFGYLPTISEHGHEARLVCFSLVVLPYLVGPFPGHDVVEDEASAWRAEMLHAPCYMPPPSPLHIPPKPCWVWALVGWWYDLELYLCSVLAHTRSRQPCESYIPLRGKRYAYGRRRWLRYLGR